MTQKFAFLKHIDPLIQKKIDGEDFEQKNEKVFYSQDIVDNLKNVQN